MAETPLGFEAKALEIVAPFVNQVQISRLGTGLVRLSFAESPFPDMPFYRVAIMMTIDDARSLVSVLQKALNADVLPPPADRRPN